MARYCIVTEPVVSLRDHRGVREVSLRDALLEAHNFERLALSEAIQEPPIIRLMVAILLRALGPPADLDDFATRWDAGSFPCEQLADYLDRVAPRFDLFDAEAPFAQVAGLRTAKDETKSASLLVPSVPGGNNVPLFGVHTDGDEFTLSPAEAARWLLVTHAYDTAAIKSGAADDPQAKGGKTSGNPTGPLGQFGAVIPSGRTLFETLMLNLPWRPDGLDPRDLPHWEREEPLTSQWERRPATGVVDLLSWTSRRIRLVPSVDDDGETVVSRVIVAAGDRLEATPEYEPHTAWRLPKVLMAGDPTRRPVRLRAGQAAWQGLSALLALSAQDSEAELTSSLLRQIAKVEDEEVLPDDYPLSVRVFGVDYGNMSAVIENTISDEIPLPVVALRSQEFRLLIDAIAHQAGLLVQASNRLHARLRESLGGDEIPWDKSQRLGEILVHRLDGVVRRILVGLQRPGAAAHSREIIEAAWQSRARVIARGAVEPALSAASATPGAFLGREQRGKTGKGGQVRRMTPGEAEWRFTLDLNTILPLSRPSASPGTDPAQASGQEGEGR